MVPCFDRAFRPPLTHVATTATSKYPNTTHALPNLRLSEQLHGQAGTVVESNALALPGQLRRSLRKRCRLRQLSLHTERWVLSHHGHPLLRAGDGLQRVGLICGRQ